MEVVPGNTLLPGDPRLIDHIVCELKSQGIFDQFRKECIADVDTKPAYQNLRQRVEGSVTGFLKTQVWKPDMNKNQLREALRKNIYESGFLETGVERIVDQVVNPKINAVFLPQVEDVVYKFLGLEKPTRNVSINGPLTINTIDLLPTDLDPISPDSEVLDKTLNKSDKSNDLNLDDSKNDEYESPPFEPITDQNVLNMEIDDSSNDSKISGISGLTSHDSNLSDRDVQLSNQKQGPDVANPDSQLSKVSSNSRLSIITNESKHASEKMDISDDTQSNSNQNDIFSLNFENKLPQNGLEIQQEIKDELEAIRMEINGDYKHDGANTPPLVKTNESSVETTDNQPKMDDSKPIVDDNDETNTKTVETEKTNTEETKTNTEETKQNTVEIGQKVEHDETKEDLPVVVQETKEEPTIDEPSSADGLVKPEFKKTDKPDGKSDKPDGKSDKPDGKSDKSDKTDGRSDKSDKTERTRSDSERKRDKYSEKDKKSERDKDRRSSSSKSTSSSSKDKDRSRDKSKDSRSKDKESKDSKEKEYKDKDSKEPKDKESKDKDPKEYSSKDKDPKEYSSKDKDSKDYSSKDKDPKDYSSKDKDSKEYSSKEKESSSKPKDDKDKDKYKDKTSDKSKEKSSSSSSKYSSRDRSRTDSKSESKSDSSKYSTRKDSSKKPDDSRSRSEDSRSKDDKSRSSKTSSKSKESSTSKSSSSKEKKSSSSRDKKDPKKASKKDDHSSSRDKKDNRRSADRDSNDGSSGVGNTASGNKKETSNSSASSKSKSDNSDSNSNSDNSGQSDATLNYQPNTDTLENSLSGQNSPKVATISPLAEIESELIKIKKPKFASNIFEARKLMKIRKKLKKQQRKLELAKERLDSPTIDLDSVEDTDSMDSGKLHIVETDDDKLETDDGANTKDKTIDAPVVNKATWDEIEKKLSETVNQNVDFDSYGEKDDSLDGGERSGGKRASKRFSEDEDCLYFNNQVSPTTERFLKSVESYQKSTLPPEKTKMAPPNLEKSAKKPRKANLKQNQLTDEVEPDKKPNKKPKPKGRKRKNDENNEDNENNNKNNTYNVVDLAEEYDNVMNPSPSASNTSNGSIEPKKTGRKKKKTNSDFPLPLSPDSDISGTNFDVKTKMAEEPPATKNSRVSALKSQRYSSDDLYKPRPFVSGSSRRQRGLLNNADKK